MIGDENAKCATACPGLRIAPDRGVAAHNFLQVTEAAAWLGQRIKPAACLRGGNLVGRPYRRERFFEQTHLFAAAYSPHLFTDRLLFIG